jgi:phage recombination protein Bet
MNAVVTIEGPRLPYHPAVSDRFGVDQGAWRVLTDAVFPAAKRPESIIMALAYCQARKLDIFKKPVQIVPIWDSKRGEMVDTVWPGIAELRTTAMRTGSFAGFEETTFGPMIEETLGTVAMRYPEWAQCTVYRLVGGVRVPFVGPKVYWTETYATAKKDTAAPNAMWRKRPRGQIEKCAEAAALRRAFPEELGNEYAAEEVEGREMGQGIRDVTVTAAATRTLHGGFDAPALEAPAEVQDHDDTPAHDAEAGEVTDDDFPGDPGTGEGEGAGSAEAVADDAEPAPDPAIARADRTIADLKFKSLAELKTLKEEGRFKAFVAMLRVQHPAKADEVEKALTDALEAFG